ncbi:hemagglutinin repeat-containing protein, partial [Pseudomonas pseudonitroreducens]
ASNDAHRIHKEIANNAARIEARGDLEITAGRDLISAGSVLQAGGNASLTAGRDLRLEAAQEVDSFDFQSRRVTGNVTSVTQHGSDVQVGGNLELNAGRDLSAVASRIDAARDIAMSAGRDVVLASAANEEHSDAK